MSLVLGRIHVNLGPYGFDIHAWVTRIYLLSLVLYWFVRPDSCSVISVAITKHLGFMIRFMQICGWTGVIFYGPLIPYVLLWYCTFPGQQDMCCSYTLGTNVHIESGVTCAWPSHICIALHENTVWAWIIRFWDIEDKNLAKSLSTWIEPAAQHYNLSLFHLLEKPKKY